MLQMKEDINLENMSCGEVQRLFKKVYDKAFQGTKFNYILKVEEYKKLLRLTVAEHKFVSKTACYAVITLHNIYPEFGNIFDNLLSQLHHDGDISSLVTCILNLIIVTSRNEAKENTHILEWHEHPLNSLIEIRPDALEIVLKFMEDFLLEVGSWIAMLPFFKKTLCFPRGLVTKTNNLETWRIFSSSASPRVFFVIFLWAKVPDTFDMKKILLGSDSIISTHKGVRCLVFASVTWELSTKGYVSRKILNIFHEAFLAASSSIQSLAMIVLCQAICNGLKFNLFDLIELGELLIKEANLPAELIWIFMSSMTPCVMLTPSSKDKVFEKLEKLFESSLQQQNTPSTLTLDIIEESFCTRLPGFEVAVSISNLLTDLERNEQKIVKWLNILKKNNCLNPEVKILVEGYLIGGTYDIKMKCLQLLENSGSSTGLFIYLFEREQDPNLLISFFQTLCLLPKDEKVEKIMLELLAKLEVRPTTLLEYHYRIWLGDKQWNRMLEFLILKSYSDIEDIEIQVQIIRKMLLFGGSGFAHHQQLTPVLLSILKKFTRLCHSSIALSMALDTLIYLSDIGLQDILVVFDIVLKQQIWLWTNGSNTDHTLVTNCICKLIEKIPWEISNEKALSISIKMLWAFVVDKTVNSKSPYKTMRKFSLGDFKKEILPPECKGHDEEEKKKRKVYSEDIPEHCWVHLLKTASNKHHVGYLFRYLLKKDFTQTGSKTTISMNSLALFKGLWKYVQKNYSHRNKSDNVEMCLIILGGRFTKVLPIKNFEYLENIINGKNILKKRALIMLIRQGKYHKKAKEVLKRLATHKKCMKDEDLILLSKLFRSVKRAGRFFFKKVLDDIFSRIQFLDDKVWAVLLKGVWKVQHSIMFQYIMKEIIASIWFGVLNHQENSQVYLEHFSKFSPKFLDGVWGCCKDGDSLRKMDLFCLVSLQMNDALMLRPLIYFGLNSVSLRDKLRSNILQVLSRIFLKAQKTNEVINYNWLFFLPTVEIQDELAEEFVFAIFTLSTNALAGNISVGTMDSALQIFPLSCCRIFIGHDRKDEFHQTLLYWYKKISFHPKFVRACLSALISMHQRSEGVKSSILNNILL